MTMDEILATDKVMLSASDIAEVLGSDPMTIRLMARLDPDRVGFPFTFVGNRMKIPRAGFLRWMNGDAIKEIESKTMWPSRNGGTNHDRA